MAEHRIKAWPEYYQPLKRGDKTFEIRKNDRDYKVGDTLIIEEWDPAALLNNRGYTADAVEAVITYITDFGQPKGQVVLGIRLTGAEVQPPEAVQEAQSEATKVAERIQAFRSRPLDQEEATT